MNCIKILWHATAAALMAGVMFFHTEAQAVTVDFEDLSLATQSNWSGPDPNGQHIHQTDPYLDDYVIGKFTSTGVDLSNSYSQTYYSWSGWAYSNMTYNPADYMPGDCNPGNGSNGNPHPVPTGWTSQFYAAPGRDASRASTPGNYALGYVSWSFKPSVDFSAPITPNGMYITNNNYVYYILKEGDPLHYSRQFTNGDYLKLTIIGQDATGNTIGSVDCYLADFRDSASRLDNPRKDNYISNQWTWVDLSSLGGGVKSLKYEIFSTDSGDYGINTPTYFAMDNLTTVGNPANDLVWGGGAGPNTSVPANWNGQNPVPGKGWGFTSAVNQSVNNDLTANAACGSITFAASSKSFTLNGNAINLLGDVSSLSTFPQDIELPLVLDGGDRLLHSVSGELTIGGVISENGGSFGIVKTGPGTVIFAGNNAYHGPTRIEVGTLALIDGGDISPDSTVSVAAGATFEIISGNHMLGAIDGLGTTQVDGNATLTATSIVQNSLIIGATHSSAVPEPGTYLMLLAAVAGLFLGRKLVFHR